MFVLECFALFFPKIYLLNLIRTKTYYIHGLNEILLSFKISPRNFSYSLLSLRKILFSIKESQ